MDHDAPTLLDDYVPCYRCGKPVPKDEVSRLRIALSRPTGFVGTNGELPICEECAAAVVHIITRRIVRADSLAGAFVSTVHETPADA